MFIKPKMTCNLTSFCITYYEHNLKNNVPYCIKMNETKINL